MANHNQREEARPRRPRNRKDLEMKELPTFTKWLTPFCNSDVREDSRSKSKRVSACRPTHRAPVIVLDSSEEGREVTGDASILYKEEGMAVVGEGDSISARRGGCCWRRAKPTTRPQCSPECHVSLRRSRVVANAPEEVVAAGKEGMTVDVPRVPKVDDGVVNNMQVGVLEEGGFRSAKRVGWFQAFPIFAGRKRVVSSDSNLRKDGAATIGIPDLHKERRGCLPRKKVASEVSILI